MKLLSTYYNQNVDFAIWNVTGRYVKFSSEDKILTRTLGVDKERWIYINSYKRIPRKINTQQDSLD
ncbi:hypothetical protein HYP07_gp088 [Vibrio phage JSF3]|uniref:hypothetical protein n=1 Tax=Vibrio phage JSF3 TaxID=1916111 RepID=UPI000B5DEED1|nr:hypothetical protein HYP07_gp088 [Vibrio phage JSF3]APD18100.1 hypothetical protein [Vibrio phage JSF3]